MLFSHTELHDLFWAEGLGRALGRDDAQSDTEGLMMLGGGGAGIGGSLITREVCIDIYCTCLITFSCECVCVLCKR